jgi:hypothetical protein
MSLVGARGVAKRVMSGPMLALMLARATPSPAATPAVDVRVNDAPPGCIDAAELRERVAALQQPLDAAQPITVGVELRADEPAGYLADVIVQSRGRGTQLRSVATRSSSCRDLDDALLVVIDALVTGAAVEEPGAKTPALALSARTERARGNATAGARDSSRGRVSHSASLGGALELGALPGASASARLDARFVVGARAAVRLGIGTTPWTTSRALETASIDFRLTSGRALGCWDFVAADWGYLDACAGLDAGVVTASSGGLSSSSLRTRPAVWAVSEASLGVRLGPLLPELHGFWGPAFVRDSYRATDTAGIPHTLHRTPAFRWGAGVAVGVQFP